MSNAEYSGKIAQERLLKATVIPASELAKQKQEALERANAFSRSAEDESFYARIEKSVSPDYPTPIGQKVGAVTREPYEEQP